MSKKSDIPVSRESTQPRAPKPNSPPAPWSAFGNLREEMERLFDAFEPSQWFDKGLGRSGALARDVVLSPAVDLSETEKGYAMTAELPGLTSDQVAVKISNGSLTISGEKSVEEEKEDETYHLRERHWGSFQRSIRLPDDVDRDKISAEFAKGVLTVTLPKSAEALASERKIAVKPV
ncbi:Hsp20/alpha crystallin family protein [Salipiger mangrovisoli]|uniref:Hsp20/alpha crystallin family protein n=1 Tax=Salipiger mangrovisoli TaxID=2865933 RepID=A0ABR9X5S7_9RHOB|nr:Hsp20/alpha crystallin family protein [Salipiger mangrovisoli]MBE9638801.1 Hsp20/alpha crystallin family protein [Salipiger mangrovisoli]